MEAARAKDIVIVGVCVGEIKQSERENKVALTLRPGEI